MEIDQLVIVQISMQFEWDEAKNLGRVLKLSQSLIFRTRDQYFQGVLKQTLENIRKHEIDFTDLPKMFERPMLIELDDRFDYGEDRWFGIGFLGNGVAVVIWTERQNDVIRIISARRANRYERQRFDPNFSHNFYE